MTTIQILTILFLVIGLWAALSLCFFKLIKAQEAISPAREALNRAQQSVRRKNLFLQVLKRHRRDLRATLSDIEAELLAEKKKGALTLQFFAEPVRRKHWFTSVIEISYRVQVALDGSILGAQGVIASHRVRQPDIKAINKKLEEIAKPFMEAGLVVSVRKLSAGKKDR